MHYFPTLYTKTKTNKIQEWDVTAIGDEIHVTFGQQGGKKNTKITKATPKNVGRANETTAFEQAILEAKSKWQKQLRTGYATSIEELETRVSWLPMLAGDYTKVGHRIVFPCDVSRKLDGLRCVAVVDGDTVTFWSRGGKEYKLPHLVDQVLKLSKSGGYKVFDGELYCHGVPLQKITSWAKKPQADTEQLKFVIFDIPSDEPWEDRRGLLGHVGWGIHCLKLDKLDTVDNVRVNSVEEARVVMNQYLEEGYEGLMLRNLTGRYMWGTRNGDLQKWKDMQDAEAAVIAANEDKNGEGVLVCRMKNGNLFECKMKGDHDFRKISNMKTLIGKYITYKYQTLTVDGKPQFPVGIAVRECDQEGNPIV